MSLRDSLNKNPAATLGIFGVLVVLAGWFIYAKYIKTPTAQPAPVVNVYWYDLNKGTVIVEKSDKVAPIPSPTDPQKSAVMAYVFSCGDCSNEKERFVAFLEQYTPAAKAEMIKSIAGAYLEAPPPPDVAKIMNDGHVVSAADTIHWVRADSEEGHKLQNSTGTHCNGQPARICTPK